MSAAAQEDRMKTLIVTVGLVFVLSGAIRAQSSGGLHVYDSTGKTVGAYVPILSCNDTPWCGSAAVVVVGTTSVVIPISSAGPYLHYSFRQLLRFGHLSTDCTGQRDANTS